MLHSIIKNDRKNSNNSTSPSSLEPFRVETVEVSAVYDTKMNLINVIHQNCSMENGE